MKNMAIALPNGVSQFITLPTIMGNFLFYIFSTIVDGMALNFFF